MIVVWFELGMIYGEKYDRLYVIFFWVFFVFCLHGICIYINNLNNNLNNLLIYMLKNISYNIL